MPTRAQSARRRQRKQLLAVATLLLVLGRPAPGLAAATPSPARPLVALVAGTVSAGGAAEQKSSARVADRIGRWLEAMAIPYVRLTDEDVIARRFGTTSQAILCYNPALPTTELAQLRAYVANGGKLLVFYSSDLGLADLMGVRLGAYQFAGSATRWQAIGFNRNAPRGMPTVVRQASRNIRPVYPASREARVIAHWRDERGKALPDPAWVQSPAGFWMTHIPTDDDPEAKKRMLLALLGFHDPAIWQAAAGQAVRTAGAIAYFPDRAAALADITRRAAGQRSARAVTRIVSQIRERESTMRLDHGRGEYEAVVRGGREIDRSIAKAYAMVHASRSGEFRGAWQQSPLGLFPDDWPRTIATLADAGFTAVFPKMADGGLAHYRSQALPTSEAVAHYGDQLAACVAAAAGSGVEVHPWKICWNLDNAPAELIAGLERDNRLQMNAAGEHLPWLCPAHPENYALEMNVVRELARNYAIDGIHLDYIRYPGRDSCYCSTCRERFEADLGATVSSWPAAVVGGDLGPGYRVWRQRHITRLVQAVNREVKKINPNLKVSAAVYGHYPSCANSFGQNWGQWLRYRHVDFVCPMNYEPRLDKFRRLVEMQLALPGADGRVYPGIGVTANDARLDSGQTITQIDVLRTIGANGFMIYELNDTVANEILPMLSLGVTKR